MNRNQIKKTLEKIIDKMNDIILELDDLKSECENTIEEIEPYENKWDLTPQQEERKEWLENLAQDLENTIDSINDNVDISTLEYYID